MRNIVDDKELQISVVAYELYKQNWIDSNTSEEDRLAAIREYSSYVQVCLEHDWSFAEFDDYIQKAGYPQKNTDGLSRGKKYFASYEDFMKVEYNQSTYICALLKDDGLISLYHDDLMAEMERG